MLCTIVAVPVDMGRSLYFFILIHSFQLYCIIIIATCNNITGSDNSTGCSICDLSIALQD